MTIINLDKLELYMIKANGSKFLFLSSKFLTVYVFFLSNVGIW